MFLAMVMEVGRDIYDNKLIIMKKHSEFGKISSTDVINALYIACAASSYSIGACISIPTKANLLNLIGTFVSAFLGSLFKSNVTNSNGQVFKKEEL